MLKYFQNDLFRRAGNLLCKFNKGESLNLLKILTELFHRRTIVRHHKI